MEHHSRIRCEIGGEEPDAVDWDTVDEKRVSRDGRHPDQVAFCSPQTRDPVQPGRGTVGQSVRRDEGQGAVLAGNGASRFAAH